MSLTDIKCRTAKPQAKLFRLYDSGGLYLEVMPNGSRYWRYKYHLYGKEKRLALGVYPEISLSDARKMRDKAKEDRRNGYDPVLLKKENTRLAEYASGQTFEAITLEWLKTYSGRWKPRYAAELKRRLENNLFPSLGKMPMRQITTPMLYHCLKIIEKRAPEVAKSLRQKCGEIFRFAIQTGRADRDITHELAGALKPKKTKHRASLEIDELPAFLKTLKEARESEKISYRAYLAVRIMLLTFPRRTELMCAEWPEIDFNKALWTIPASRMKMGLEHLVPLSKQAIALFRELHALNGHKEFVFQSTRYANKPISKTIIVKTIKTIGYQSKMTCHGFRALGMGIAKEKLNYRHEIPDRQLAHVPENEIDRAYDRAKYLPQRTEMMQQIADYIDQITNTQPSQQNQRIENDRPINANRVATGFYNTTSSPITYGGYTYTHKVQSCSFIQPNEARTVSEAPQR